MKAFNIDTPEGMGAAKEWTSDMIENRLNHLATWHIPRAKSAYRFDKITRIAWRIHGGGDGPTERVLAELGWKVEVPHEA